MAVSVDHGATPSPDLATSPDLAYQGPLRLSETGLYADITQRTLTGGLFQFTPRYPLWSDSDETARYLWLPPSTKIDTSDLSNWTFPVGTKAWKQFSRAGVMIETRMLQKVDSGAGDSAWFKVAYLWDDAGTDATAVPDGLDDAHGTTHEVPTQLDCAECHQGVSDVLIGVSAIQLGSATGHGALSQLAAAGWLTHPPAQEVQPPGQGNVQDALGYLHGNCGHCHNDRSAIAQDVFMRLRLGVNVTSPDATATYLSTQNRRAHHVMPNVGDVLVVPGDPDHSQLWARMSSRDPAWQMPPECTKLVDPAGLATIRSWILGL